MLFSCGIGDVVLKGFLKELWQNNHDPYNLWNSWGNSIFGNL